MEKIAFDSGFGMVLEFLLLDLRRNRLRDCGIAKLRRNVFIEKTKNLETSKLFENQNED